VPPAKKSAPRRRVEPETLVPDTSVLVDGRLTARLQRGELDGCTILVANASIAELEFQANRGRESGFSGLDEVVKLQELKDTADVTLEFIGPRPTPEAVEMAKAGEIDAMIRQVAVDHDAKLLTSDRVQAHVARALGLNVEWIRPITDQKEWDADIGSLAITQMFDKETMSVHLKQNVVPMAKKGTPAGKKLVKIGERPMELRELTRMRREIIEAAKRDADSFIEIEREGATVVQLGNMRIAIAQPPFSDAVEITAVRPVASLTLEEYHLADELTARLADYQRGVFVSGAPGSGKSTFVTAVAEWLRARNVIVKTMESPRDLQVSDEITQYAPLEKDMELTADVILLVRPDYVIYDEVRKTDDFEIFADMRLAGVGLVGVTHANRAIDAVQRLIGRVELGMIPQVVDTVIHIEKGKVQQVLEMQFTVKTPAGMTEADLARPVIVVRDFLTKQSTHEIYTYGEQVVVMPLEAATRGGGSAQARLAGEQLKHNLRRYVDAAFDVQMTGDSTATLYVPEKDIPMLIGKGGANVKQLEEAVGVKLDIRPMTSKAGWDPARGRTPKEFGKASGKGRFDSNRPLRREAPASEEEDDEELAEEERVYEAGRGADKRYASLVPELRKSKKNVVLLVDRNLVGTRAQVVVDDEPVMQAVIGGKGEIRISRGSDAGDAILDALARGAIVTLRV